MRLQGAILYDTDTLLDGDGAPLPGVERFLSLMKMEDVWMYLLTRGERLEAGRALERAGLDGYLRGILAAAEHGHSLTDPALYQKAVRRLRTAPRATVAFTTREDVLFSLKEAGVQVVLVGSGFSREAAALADMTISDYTSMTQITQE